MVFHAYPDWVRTLDDDRLHRHFDDETLRRGRAYASQWRVGSISVGKDIVTAQVRGNSYRPYYTSVAAPNGVGSLASSCSCPMQSNCKHAAALIFHMRTVLERRTTPQWQQALKPLVAGRASRGRSGDRLALQINEWPAGFWLRPLRNGARDKWVKAGAEWEDMRFGFGGQLEPAQREPLARLLAARRMDAYAAQTQRVTQLMLSDLRPDAWAELRQAVSKGVELLPGTDQSGSPLPPVELSDEPFAPTVVIDRVASGLRVTAVLIHAGEEHSVPHASFAGYPANGAAVRLEERLLLGSFTRELSRDEHQLFANQGTIDIPDSDVGLFASGFLPRLRERLDVRLHEGIDLPVPSPPTAICRVEFAAVGTAEDQPPDRPRRDEGQQPDGGRWGSVDWSFRYRIGDSIHTVPAVPGVDDPPVRDPRAEAELADSLPAGPWRTPGPDGLTELRAAALTGRGLIDFVTVVLPALAEREDVDVEITGDVPAFREASEAPAVTLRVSDPAEGDWFDLGVQVTVEGERVPFEALLRALSLGDDHLLLDSGTWFPLDHPELDQLRLVIEEARGIVDHDGDTFRIRPEHAGLWEELVSLGVVAEQSAAWREAASALLDLDQLPEAADPEGLRAELRPYQHTGLRWLAFLWRSRLGGILADEMGLGKTVQALALAASAHEAGELTAPMLVVAPTSVVGTWAAEAAKFTPHLRVATISATEKRRGVPLAESVGDAQLVLTSYTLLRLEAEHYEELEWSAVLLDEAQFVKNHASKAYKAVRKLRARTKVALTGTPLENNLMDLWSLLSITAPGLFPNPKAFGDVYRKPIEAGNTEALARLHRRIKPLILRRTKAAVATELPEKQEQLVPVELTAAHRRIYDKHLTRERQKILGLVGDMGRNRITILRSLTLLRQLSLSPALVDGEYAAHSAKIDVLVEMLNEVIAEGHRALVFSQFTGFLGLVRERLGAEGIAYEYLDGRTRDRGARITAFREGDAPAFLISLKAGGFGLTLTEADYVFILDPWWNPAAESQAIDRAHRIGQDKPVNVYRLVATDTIEEKVVALQARKRQLFDQVVGTASDMAAPLSVEDVRGLLDP